MREKHNSILNLQVFQDECLKYMKKNEDFLDLEFQVKNLELFLGLKQFKEPLQEGKQNSEGLMSSGRSQIQKHLQFIRQDSGESQFNQKLNNKSG